MQCPKCLCKVPKANAFLIWSLLAFWYHLVLKNSPLNFLESQPNQTLFFMFPLRFSFKVFVSASKVFSISLSMLSHFLLILRFPRSITRLIFLKIKLCLSVSFLLHLVFFHSLICHISKYLLNDYDATLGVYYIVMQVIICITLGTLIS